MWSIIARWGPPSRWNRFCCGKLKEYAGKGRFIVTGVRWEESRKRKDTRGIYETITPNIKNKLILNNDNDARRQLFENCRPKSKMVCNPIIDWSEKDVWAFLNAEKVPVNPLYAEDQTRVGCIGCPMASTRKRCRQFLRWPEYKALYLLAFSKYIERCKSEGKQAIRDTVEDLFHWWMEDGVLPGQLSFDDLAELSCKPKGAACVRCP